MRRFAFLASAVAFLSLPFVSTVFAAPPAPPKPGTHGLSFYGQPDLPANFAKLPFALPQAPQGGTLKMTSIGTFDCLNKTFKCIPVDGLDLVTETLMTRNPEEPYSLYGLVAESVQLSPDGTSIEFFLHPKAAWSDGSPITPQDVVFSFETLRDQGMPYFRGHYKNIAKVAITGPRSIKFTMSAQSKSKETPFIVAILPLLNKAHFTKNKLRYEDPIHKPYLSSGPYSIEKVELGRYITYKKNTQYWGRGLPVNAGRYNFDRIQYDYYRDSQTALQAFKAGNSTAYRESLLQVWNKDHKGPLYSQGKIIKSEQPNTAAVGMRAISLNTRLPLFQDKRVREALILAFDRVFLAQTILPGTSFNTSYFDNTDLAAPDKVSAAEKALFANIMPSLDPTKLKNISKIATKQSRRANLTQALGLLKQAGWTLKQGVLRNAQGKPFVFELTIATQDEQKIAQTFARNLKDIGIEVSIKLMDAAQYEKRKQDRSFEALTTWWAVSKAPGDELNLYWSCAAKDNNGSRNYPGICSPEADALMAKITATTKRTELQTLTHALDRVLMDGAWLVPLFYPSKQYIAHSSAIDINHAPPDVLKGYQFWFAKPAK